MKTFNSKKHLQTQVLLDDSSVIIGLQKTQIYQRFAVNRREAFILKHTKRNQSILQYRRDLKLNVRVVCRFRSTSVEAFTHHKRAETVLQYTSDFTTIILLLLLVAPVNIGLLNVDRIRRSQNVISCAVYAKLRYC